MKYPITLRITIPSTDPQVASISHFCSTSLTKTWENITDSPFWYENPSSILVYFFPTFPHTDDTSTIEIGSSWIINFKSKTTSISKRGVYVDAEIELIFKESKQIHLRDDNNRAELIDTLLRYGWEYPK